MSARRNGASSLQLPKPPLAQVDEASTDKRELEKCYNRIADLQTRIHDLTLQVTDVSLHGNVPFFKEMLACVVLLDSTRAGHFMVKMVCLVMVAFEVQSRCSSECIVN